MYYSVSLLDDSVDKSMAEIIPYHQDDTVTFNVLSDNPKLKAHLEKVLQKEAYILSPGKNSKGLFSDGVVHLYPNTLYYLQALPEILAWRGYNCKFVNETHKSFNFIDEDAAFTLKAVNENIYMNEQGERIVKIVPQGYVAVHTDGRTVAGGRYLNANIDKEGSNWTLVENPYEGMSLQERQQEHEYMKMQLQKYHPGVHEQLYQHREQDEGEFFQARQEFQGQGRNLEEFYAETQDPESVASPQVGFDTNLPQIVEENAILYNPETGMAVLGKNWPPTDLEGFDALDWYVFEDPGLSDEEKNAYRDVLGDSPRFITGLDKGLVQADKDLDVSEGFEFKLPDSVVSNMTTDGIVVNQVPEEDFELTGMTQKEYREKVKKAHERMQQIKSFVNERDPETGERTVSDKLENIEIPDLRGLSANWLANFEGRQYQKAMILALIEKTQYEKFGGPKGWHGNFQNVKYGLGKTAAVTAANAVLRNQGVIENGTQTTIVTAPNKNIYVWQNEVGKFLGEHAAVIDGGRESRVQQWEELIDQAKKGEMPTFVIVGSSKFRYTKVEDATDEEESWELDVDAQYMELLAMGGRSGTKEVAGSHVGAFVIDESGQYVNPDTARHRALQKITDAVYKSKGLTWSLNGDISGNSATDTISELSFINKFARENYIALAQEYTKTNRNTGRESKSMNRRIWKDYNRLRDFMYTFGDQVFQLDGRTVAGEDFGFMRTQDESAPLGKNWGRVYLEAERKIAASAEIGELNKSLGLMSLLIGASFGAVEPARLLEYDIGAERMISDAAALLDAEGVTKFREEIRSYADQTTWNKNRMGLGRLPKKDLDVLERNRIFNETFSDASKEAMTQALASWDAPILDGIIANIDTEITQNNTAGSNLKMGVAGFSKRAINTLYRKLRSKYSEDKVLINLIDGDTPADKVSAQQDAHQNEKDRVVISLVTGAGLYGLSLPAERSWRFPTWNSAKAGQYEGRFHRKAEQKNVMTVVVPDGIAQYMRELELMKSEVAREATNALIDADDDRDELDIRSIGTASSFLDRLRGYRPRILETESGGE